MGMIRMIDSIANAGDTDISIKIENEPIQVRKMMLDGSADFAILPTTMAALVYNKGMDYRLIAIPVWGTLYLFGNDTSITSWENLRNKRVYVMARGMTPDVLFRYLLQYNGINPEKDVTLDYSFPTHIDLANAVAAGQATLGVISEPLASMVISRNKSVHSLFDLNREWENIQGSPIALTALLVKADIIKENPQKVEQFLLDYEKSSLWVNQQPDSAAALIVKYGILPDHEVALRAIPGSRLNFVRARDIRPQIISYLNVFYTMNPDIIGGKIPDEKFFY
jgi:NitT/TauT family transport system substrate-binding protein